MYLFAPKTYGAESTKAAWESFHKYCESGNVKAAWAVENGLAEAVMKMSFGNEIGFKAIPGAVKDGWYNTMMFDFIVAELDSEIDCEYALKIGETTKEAVISLDNESATIDELASLNDATLEGVYPTVAKAKEGDLPTFAYNTDKVVSPKVMFSAPRHIRSLYYLPAPPLPATGCACPGLPGTVLSYH